MTGLRVFLDWAGTHPDQVAALLVAVASAFGWRRNSPKKKPPEDAE